MKARAKAISLTSGAVVSGLALMTWTQTWFTVSLNDAAISHPPISVAGDVAAPAISALSIAGLALVAAMAIAGGFFRVVLAVLQGVIGACMVLSASLALNSPVAAVSPSVTAATSVSGEGSVSALIEGISTSVWPWLALASGVLMIAIGGFVLSTRRGWPESTRKYQSVRFEDAATRPSSSAAEFPSEARILEWDALSDGSDPTSG